MQICFYYKIKLYHFETMENIAGIPVSLLFSVIGCFGVYIFFDFRRQVVEENARIRKRLDKVEASAKELSREEFDQVKLYVRESINIVINSKDFRDDLKTSIKDIMLHIDNNKSKADAAIYAHFESMLNDINYKLNEFKQK